MKNVTINLNITNIKANTQPLNIIPCPRVNVFQHPIVPEHITQAGTYTYNFVLDDTGRCGVDVFSWRNDQVQISSDQPIVSVAAGQNLDQIKRTINITQAGIYNVSVAIA